MTIITKNSYHLLSTYNVSGTSQEFHLISLMTLWGSNIVLIKDEQTDAQRSQVIFPRMGT